MKNLLINLITFVKLWKCPFSYQLSINMVTFSVYLNDLGGQIFTFFILTVAAAEVAIGLAILTVFFRNRGSVEIDDIDVMKG